MKKFALQGLGLFGITIFLPLFLFTFTHPQLIEESGKSFVEWKLRIETEKKIDSIAIPKTSGLPKLLEDKAKELQTNTEVKLNILKRHLKNDIPAILAAEIANMRDLDCECRKKWEERLRANIQLEVVSLENAKTKIADFSQAKYMQIVEKLTLDIRIFLGTNTVVFICLYLITFFKPRALNHLFLPGILMLASTIICSYFYIFNQDWFYTIIYNDYVGYGYVGYLIIVFGILCDIAFNKAKITTNILNSILESIGRAATLVPC